MNIHMNTASEPQHTIHATHDASPQTSFDQIAERTSGEGEGEAVNVVNVVNVADHPGWQCYTTDAGVPYFYNIVTGKTVWELPQ